MTSVERREWDGCDDVEEMPRAIARLTVVVAHRCGTRRWRQSGFVGVVGSKLRLRLDDARRRSRKSDEKFPERFDLGPRQCLLLGSTWNFCRIFAFVRGLRLTANGGHGFRRWTAIVCFVGERKMNK